VRQRATEHQAQNGSRRIHWPFDPGTGYRRLFVGEARGRAARSVGRMDEDDSFAPPGALSVAGKIVTDDPA
jgi:hypothetical protein